MKSARREWLLLLTAIIVCLPGSLLWGETGTANRYGGQLRIGVPKEPLNLDTRLAGASQSSNWGFQHLYDHLVEWKEKSTSDMGPVLATTWKRVDDLTWIVTLRKGVMFHSGREMTAQDVALNYDYKINSSKYQKEKGWKPARVRSAVDALKSVEALDRYTLKFTMKYMVPAFTSTILGWGLQYGPSDTELAEKMGREFSYHPVGTGPFRFVEIIPGDHIIYERFEKYWGKKPYLDKVIFRTIPDGQTRILALQAGEIDVATELPLNSVAPLKKDPRIKLYQVSAPVRIYGVLFFNHRRWPMNQLKFRQAVAMGIDWHRVITAGFPEGTAAFWRTLFKGSWAENPQAEKLLPAYNPAKAKALLQEVEKEAGKKVQPLVAIARKEFGGLQANILKIAANQAKQIGLTVNVEVLENEVEKDRTRRMSDFDMAMRSMKGPSRDPQDTAKEFDSRVAVTYHDNTNVPGYKNPLVNELIDKANGTFDQKERLKHYRELETIVMKDLVVLPLFNAPQVYGVRNNVHDFKPHPSAFLHIVTGWNNMWVDRK